MKRRQTRRAERHTLPLEYAASVHPGLEAVAGEEIQARLDDAQIVESQRGWVIFTYPGDANALLQLRTTEDVFAVLYRTDALPFVRKEAVPLVGRMAQHSRHWEQALTQFYQTHHSVKRVTYRVIGQMTGQHGFRRQELADAVGMGVQMRWPGWKPVADDAHLEVWTVTIGTWSVIAVRFSDRSMRHRAYKTGHRPASLRPSLAAAMVALSKPQPGDHFCDPMCGAGTILAERGLYGPYDNLIGGDIDAAAIEAAQENLKNVQVNRELTLYLWDARQMPVRSGSLDVVVSNLPFGEQIGSHASNPALYARLFGELIRILRPGGRAVLLSGEKELMRDLIHEQRLLRREQEVLIGVLGRAARIYVLRRQAD